MKSVARKVLQLWLLIGKEDLNVPDSFILYILLDIYYFILNGTIRIFAQFPRDKHHVNLQKQQK